MTRGPIEDVVKRGLEFLLARQSEEGFWTDWQLPPGESKTWTTAYVGYRLNSPHGNGLGRAQPAIGRAASWLRAQEFPDGGWGYREEMGADADSTALAILFLSSQGLVLDRSYQRLLGFQCANGGFATFKPPDGFGAWVAPHPEVTATVVAALMTRYGQGASCVDAGIEYLLGNTAADGLWNSYWWDSRLYGTEATLAALRRAGRKVDAGAISRTLHSLRPQNCFERGLFMLSLGQLGCLPERDAKIAQMLIAAQEPDGSWPSAPVLRLTNRDCEEPWTKDWAGPLFADQNRVFTTATVLASLAAYD
jgi:squalene cyclase